MLIDLVAVEYSAGREVCIAPWHRVSVGDTVETNFGTATVIATHAVTADHPRFKFMNENIPVTRIKSLYFEYEGLTNDLPEEHAD